MISFDLKSVFLLSLLSLLLISECAQEAHTCFLPELDANLKPNIHSPQPFEYLTSNDLPATWDWRDVNGTNMVSMSRNQHIPQYCGSCWAFSATSVLSDRLMVMRHADWPQINLAPQFLLDCGANVGTCHGGNFMRAFEYVHSAGIVDETCDPYLALDRGSKPDTCSDFNICRNCNHTACWAVPNPQRYFVDQFALIEHDEQVEHSMMAEIYARGPISCSINSSGVGFHEYAGGVYKDPSPHNNGTNHAISILGWGVDDGAPYWIGRNSWGTYWGERGFFRLARGENTLNIDSHCGWATLKET